MKRMQAFLLLLVTTLSFSQELDNNLSSGFLCEIKLGSGETQISASEQNKGWSPLFFSIDIDKNIHIPDFYKNRIAIFDNNGNFLKSVNCESGLAPNMNYFSLSPKGFYVTYSNFSLNILKQDGSLHWSYDFGIGAIPKAVIASKLSVFVIFPSSKAALFVYNQNQPMGSLGMEKNGVNIPFIKDKDSPTTPLTLENLSVAPEFESVKTGNKKGIYFGFFDNKIIWSDRSETTLTLHSLFENNLTSQKSDILNDSISWLTLGLDNGIYIKKKVKDKFIIEKIN